MPLQGNPQPFGFNVRLSPHFGLREGKPKALLSLNGWNEHY